MKYKITELYYTKHRFNMLCYSHGWISNKPLQDEKHLFSYFCQYHQYHEMCFYEVHLCQGESGI